MAVVCEGDVCRRVTPEEEASAAANGSSGAASGSLAELLGDELQGRSGPVSLASITGKGKVLGIYFSAHWCPPCRAFTPHLAGIYNKFKANHAEKDNFEVVFVSSDRSEEAFDEYFAEMPWLALPFSKRELKAKLGTKFKVRGIPSLFILNGETGEIITANGKDAIADDEDCSNYPWQPRHLSEVIKGDLVDKDGKTQHTDTALAGKVTLLYFSAHWCPPCKRFTPELVATYGKLKAAGKAVECVLVSGDRSEKEFKEYLGEMPWLAVPFADKARNQELNRALEVEGIPTLVVVDEHMEVINPVGRGAVAADPEGADFPWRPKPVEALGEATVGLVNEKAFVLLALASADKAAAAAKAEQLLLASATSPAGKGIVFLWGLQGDDLTQRIMDFAGHAAAPDETARKDVLIMLDIPEQVSYPTNLVGDGVTSATVSKLLADYKAGILKANPLGDDE